MENPNSLPAAARALAQGRIPTREAFLFRNPEAVVLAGEAGKGTRFKMTAVSGVPFRHPWWGNFVIDIETVKFKGQKFPVLREHMTERIVGWSDQATKEGKVEIEGTFSQVTADGKEVSGLASEGFPWGASVFARPGRIEHVQEGSEVTVNGKVVRGPGTIFRDTLIEEASFCAIGADPRARARTFSGSETEAEIIDAFSQAGEARKDDAMSDKKETPAPAGTPAPVTFTQEALDAKIAEALKTDREDRIKLSREIREAAAPGQEQIAQDLIDRGAKFDEAVRELLKDARAKLSAKREALTKDPLEGLKAAIETPAKKEPSDESALILGHGQIDEEAAKVMFASNPAIREEFYGSEASYLAFLLAESRGQIRTIKARE
jgi:hypothetical protein